MASKTTRTRRDLNQTVPLPGQALFNIADSRLSQFAEASSHAIFIYQQNRLIYANRAMESLTGYTQQELLDTDLLALIHPHFQDLVSKRAQARFKGEHVPQRYELAILTKAGEMRWVDFTAILVDLRDEPCAIGTVNDITEKKLRERQIEAIAAIATAIRSAPTRSEVIRAILTQVMALLDSDGAALGIVDPQSKEVVMELSLGAWANTTGLRIPPGVGITQQVATTGTPYLSHRDFRSDPNLYRADLVQGVASAACVPLQVPGATIGVLWSGGKSALSEGELKVLVAISDFVASAIHRETLYEQTAKQAHQFSMLWETTRDLFFEKELPSLLSTIIERALLLLGTAAGGVYFYYPERQEVQCILSKGWHDPVPGRRIALGEGMAGRVAKSRLPMIVEDYRVWPQRSPHYENLKITSVLEVPMIYQGELVGVLAVNEFEPKIRKFTEEETQLLSLFAAQAASAVHSARLFEQTSYRLRELEAISEISASLRTTETQEELLGSLLDSILKFLDTGHGSIVQYDQLQNRFSALISRGWYDRLGASALPSTTGGISGQVLKSGMPYFFADVGTDPLIDESRRSLVPAGYSGACYPLRSGDEIAGILYVSFKLPRVLTHDEKLLLNTLTEIAGSAIHRTALFQQANAYACELTRAYDATLEGWVRALDMRDHETEGHTQRVTEMTLRLAQAMKIPPAELEHIRRGALLHDIGKIAISDTILRKTGALTASEWEIVRRHPAFAFDMLSPIKNLVPALDIPYCHHERWDGDGYPRGLRGEEIPLSARIFSVVDAYDAMTNDRPYRAAMSREEAIAELKSGAGKQFDPKIVEQFLKLHKAGFLD